jgi:hypothetical protein
LDDNIEGRMKFRIVQGFLAKEYQLGCHKVCSLVTHSNQLSFKLLINYQNIMKMKQKDFCHNQKTFPKKIIFNKIYIFFWLELIELISFVVVIMLK